MTFGRFPIITKVNLSLIFIIGSYMITVNYLDNDNDTLIESIVVKNFSYPIVGENVILDQYPWQVTDVDMEYDQFNVVELINVYVTDKI